MRWTLNILNSTRQYTAAFKKWSLSKYTSKTRDQSPETQEGEDNNSPRTLHEDRQPPDMSAPPNVKKDVVEKKPERLDGLPHSHSQQPFPPHPIPLVTSQPGYYHRITT